MGEFRWQKYCKGLSVIFVVFVMYGSDFDSNSPSTPTIITITIYDGQKFSGNPRKMVATWAEKEMRNLGRLNSANIPSPRPLELRSHGKSRTKTLPKILRVWHH